MSATKISGWILLGFLLVAVGFFLGLVVTQGLRQSPPDVLIQDSFNSIGTPVSATHFSGTNRNHSGNSHGASE